LYNRIILFQETLPDENTRALFSRVVSGKQKGAYPEELRTFALTLSYYSTRAYKYVREKFKNALPNLRTMQKWYQSVDGTPGFHQEALTAIRMKVQEAKEKDKPCVLSLTVDGMYIRKKVEWVGDRHIGYVNCGENIDNDSLIEANQALVLMVNCVNMRWKIPIAYFLVEGIGSELQAGLITKGLELLHETGAEVVNVTFDGHASNMSTAKALGVDFNIDNLKTFFPHPVTEKPVEVILDTCHMLKLIRNAFASSKVLYDSQGRTISWHYIENLVEIQNKRNLHLATKIKNRHVRWVREKMNVKLAAQTLSRSVGKALRYLRESKEYGEQFKGSEATEEFIYNINDGFDILNSKNKYGKGFKAGLNPTNKNKNFQRMDFIIDYLKGIKDNKNKKLMTKSQNKTGFLGFISTLISAQNLYTRLVEEECKLDYLLTYKLSQDHVELFFSAIRGKGGFNNNPTCRQFEAAYKRLLIHHEISGSTYANCIALEPISILTVSSSKNKEISSINPVDMQRRLDEDEYFELLNEKTDENILPELSEYETDIVGHIAGFVLKRLFKIIHCDTCLNVLKTDHFISRLSQLKNECDAHIGLQTPSQDLIDICKITEREIVHLQKTDKIHTLKNPMLLISTIVMQNIGHRCFDSLHDHICLMRFQKEIM
jgi:hypothetical protein